MHNKVVLITNVDGSLSIMRFPNVELTTKDIKDECKRCIPEDAEYDIVDATTVPEDRTFRNAWTKTKNRVSVDMPKARDIHMDRIRVKRNAKLQDLDRDVMVAIEKGDLLTAQTVGLKKQVLRDIPQTFDLEVAKNPEELVALWPNELL